MNWKLKEDLLDILVGVAIVIGSAAIFSAIVLSMIVGIIKIECDGVAKGSGIATVNTMLNCYVKQPDSKLVKLDDYLKQIGKTNE